MNKILMRTTAPILLVSFMSLQGCALLYNQKFDVELTDPALKEQKDVTSGTGRANIFFGDSFWLYRNDEALFVVSESHSQGETIRHIRGVNIAYDNYCYNGCDEYIQSLHASEVEYNQSDRLYANNSKTYKLLSDKSYFVFSAPTLFGGTATFEFIDNNQILQKQLQAYSQAKAENTPDAYKRFIAENQDNTYLTDLAKQDLEKVEPHESISAGEFLLGAALGGAIIAGGLKALGSLLGSGGGGGSSSDSGTSDYDSNTRNLCEAIVKNDGYYCGQIAGEQDTQNLCTALIKGDTYYCDQIGDSANTRNLCLAVLKNDTYYCNQIGDDSNTENLCTAILKSDKYYCDQIDDHNTQNLCTAILQHDKYYCDQIH